jgi:PAS domain S-box-containing protein
MPIWNSRGWSVQARLTLVVTSAAALTVLALVLSQSAGTRQVDAVLAANAKEHGQLLDRALELEGASLATFTKDYSLWSEMARFVQTGDRTWANVNIVIGMGTYQANAVWVFDPAGSPVYAVRDSTIGAQFEPLPPGIRVRDVFNHEHFCHFFTAGPNGPIEIRGATIHPSEDDNRSSPARGYFFVARSWNQEYLAGLAKLTGKTVTVGPAFASATPTAEIEHQSGDITFVRPLPGANGKPELALTAVLRPDWIKTVRRSSGAMFAQQTAIAVLEILGLWLAFLLWVTRPLGLLRRSLASGSARVLKPLEGSHTEFKQLAQLVEQSFGHSAALVKEIAERKRTEQTLRESEEKYRLVVSNMSEAIIVAQDWKVVFANPSASKIIGYRHQQLVGMTFNEFIHPEDRWLAADGYRRRLAGEDIRDRFRFRIIRQYGEPRHLEVSAVHIEWMGRPATLSFLADITEREMAEAEIAHLNRQKQLILDAAGEGIVGLDAAGRCAFINPAAAQLLGYAPSELVGRVLHPLIHHTKADGKDYPSEECPIYHAISDGLAHTVADELFWRKDGTSFAVEYTSTPVRDGEQLTGAVVTFKDITARKQAEEEIRQKNAQLLELNNEKNQLLGMAAHDLRNPLSIVNTASTFLLDDASRRLPEAKRTEFLQRINAGSKFMLRLIDDLLDVAKIEAGRLDLDIKDGDLCRLIEDNLAINRMLADNKSIRLDFTPERSLPPLRFDRDKIDQVLNNLVSNALKFSASGTAVTVQTSRVNGSVVVSVRDQGQGIPATDLDKLFKPFGKTSVRGTAGEKSTGLGLAICRKIVEGHGGRIWAESEVGKGSVFSFSLPVATDDKL